MNGSLFLSYSHLDTESMREIRRHLDGMLLDRVRLWTDEAIAPGTSWEETLRGNLNHASAGLVLASPDYLVSSWCRRELALLASAYAERRIGAVFWVLLKPCGWSWCELKDLQAVQEPASRALLEVPAGLERDTQLLQCCERIASGAISVAGSEDPALETVRRLLSEVAPDYRIAPKQKVIPGDFSIVCRASKGTGEEAYVKVLTNTPLHRMRKLFKAASQACMKVDDPAVIQVEKVESAGKDWDERIVILSEVARGEPLAQTIEADGDKPRAERHLDLDTVRLILLRIARALDALHQLDPIAWPDGPGPEYRHVMGPLVPSNIFYDPRTQRPQISLVGCTNFLWHFFEPETFRRIINPASGTYLLPEKQAGSGRRGGAAALAPVGREADQYFLGMLALELLEARLLFKVSEDVDPPDPLEYLAEHADPQWARRHVQLAGIVRRLLAKNPRDRYPSMGIVVDELRAVEEMHRALAKYSYLRYIAPEGGDAPPGIGFSRRFYDRFLDGNSAAEALFRGEQRRRAAPGEPLGPIPDPTQHAKLLDALKAVLNYRRGGCPSSIDSVAARHRPFAIADAQFERFRDSFLDLLDEQMRQAPEGAAEAGEVRAAWIELFEPVLGEMRAARC